MAKLLVKPIDMTQPGSHKARKQVLRALDKSKQQSDNAAGALLASFDELEAVIKPRCEVVGEGNLDDLFEDLSANDFDVLVNAILGGETVPLAKSEG